MSRIIDQEKLNKLRSISKNNLDEFINRTSYSTGVFSKEDTVELSSNNKRTEVRVRKSINYIEE